MDGVQGNFQFLDYSSIRLAASWPTRPGHYSAHTSILHGEILLVVSVSALPADFELLPDSPGASQVELVVKNPPANAGDTRDVGSISGMGRSPAEGHRNPLQNSCLENSMDRGTYSP